MQKNVVAAVVYYNPDIKHCAQSIQVLSSLFDNVIIFDNTVYNEGTARPAWLDVGVIYINESKNKGIAYALNVIMQNAKDLGYKWVITFDQDSEIPTNIVSEYSKYFNRKDVGIFCSQYIDPKRKYMRLDSTGAETIEVERCITSASCTSIITWENAGKYDESLFIDLVDTDYCKRVRYIGLKILRINSVILIQHFGIVEYKDNWFSKLLLVISDKLHCINIGKLSYKKIVSPMRIYYTNRNILYLNKKHHKYGGIGYENYACKHYLTYFIFYNTASILRSDMKFKTVKAIITGLNDGMKMAKDAEKYDFDIYSE